MKFRIKTTHNRKEDNEIFFYILQKSFWYRLLIVTILSYLLLVYEIIGYGGFRTFTILYSVYCLYLPFHVFVLRWQWVRRNEKEEETSKRTEILFYDSYFEWKDLDSGKTDVLPYKLIKQLKQTKNYYILISGKRAYVVSKESVPEEQKKCFKDFLTSIITP